MPLKKIALLGGQIALTHSGGETSAPSSLAPPLQGATRPACNSVIASLRNMPELGIRNAQARRKRTRYRLSSFPGGDSSAPADLAPGRHRLNTHGDGLEAFASCLGWLLAGARHRLRELEEAEEAPLRLRQRLRLFELIALAIYDRALETDGSTALRVGMI